MNASILLGALPHHVSVYSMSLSCCFALSRHRKRSRIVTIDLTDGIDNEDGGPHRPGSSAPVNGPPAGFERQVPSKGAGVSKPEEHAGPAKAAEDRDDATGEPWLQASGRNLELQWHDQVVELEIMSIFQSYPTGSLHMSIYHCLYPSPVVAKPGKVFERLACHLSKSLEILIMKVA